MNGFDPGVGAGLLGRIVGSIVRVYMAVVVACSLIITTLLAIAIFWRVVLVLSCIGALVGVLWWRRRW